MRTVLMTILIWAAASAAGRADELGTFESLPPSSAAKQAELCNRDKSGTTTCIGARGESQAAGHSALTTRRSFEAEGTGLEPATPCGASDFESDR